jgi:hypothetical protein
MRLATLIAVLAASALASVGCGAGTPTGGDPGDKRLHALRADPAVASPPPGAQNIVKRETKATYRKPGFDAGGWDGPSVIVTFTSSASPAEVYGYYARRAEAAGWQPTAKGALDLADRWAKTFDGNAPARLFLAQFPGSRYQVTASIAAVG